MLSSVRREKRGGLDRPLRWPLLGPNHKNEQLVLVAILTQRGPPKLEVRPSHDPDGRVTSGEGKNESGEKQLGKK